MDVGVRTWGTPGTLPALLGGGEDRAPALVCPTDERVVTFGELRSAVGALALDLATRGIGPGDRVVTHVPDGITFVHTLLALATRRAVTVPLHPGLPEAGYRSLFADVAPSDLLVSPGEGAAARAAWSSGAPVVEVETDARGRVRLVEASTTTSPAARPPTRGPGEPAPAGPRPDDVALLLQTSGTTARQKLVPIRQESLAASARTIARWYDLTPADVSYCAMPLFHVHGLVASVLAALAAGGCAIVPRRLSGHAFWDHVHGYRVSWWSGSPTVLRMLLDRAPERAVPGSLRFVRSCSAALPRRLAEEHERRLGAPVVEAYGMTEAAHQISSNPLPPGENRLGSVGLPTGTDVRVVDRTGRDVAPGDAGEVLIRGPGVTNGYVDNPVANSESFTDGWLRTGDLGVLAGGYLSLVGRIKEIVVRGGENISPAEVEEVLLSHPAVADAVCFGLPSELYGEEPVAAVALSSPVPVADLLAHCRRRLVRFKVPREVHVVGEIPRTATGKPQRRRAAELLGLTSSAPAP